MNEFFDYPDLFKRADTLSNKSQRRYYYRLGAELILTVLAALLGFAASFSSCYASAQLVVLFFLAVVLMLRFFCNFEQTWYRARSAAESIKTLSWKYVMKSEPFDDEDAEDIYCERIWSLLKEDKELVSQLTPKNTNASYITDKMRSARAMQDSSRIENYKYYRIQDQKDWYTGKSRKAKTISTTLTVIIVLLVLLAVVICASRLLSGYPDNFPIDTVIVLIASLIAWGETKNYSSLAEVYCFTANEINYLAETFDRDIKKTNLSVAVADAENAFSREHSQWLSRKDA